MSVNEEVQEHSHHAQEPFDKKVAATMAIIAALLAVVSVSGHIFTTEELLHQQQASDQWSYSQAKDIRHYTAQAAHDELGAIKADATVDGRRDLLSRRHRARPHLIFRLNERTQGAPVDPSE
jgi:Domain of unknown function (DUF4337)